MWICMCVSANVCLCWFERERNRTVMEKRHDVQPQKMHGKILRTKFSYNSDALALCSSSFVSLYTLFFSRPHIFAASPVCFSPFSSFTLPLGSSGFFFTFPSLSTPWHTGQFVWICACVSTVVNIILYIIHTTYTCTHTYVVPLCRRCSSYFNIKSAETKINNIVVDCWLVRIRQLTTTHRFKVFCTQTNAPAIIEIYRSFDCDVFISKKFEIFLNSDGKVKKHDENRQRKIKRERDGDK